MSDGIVPVAVVGAGDFSLSLLTQLETVANYRTQLVIDQYPQKAFDSLLQVGINEGDIEYVKTPEEARRAMHAGKREFSSDWRLAAHSPVHVVVDCTGSVSDGAQLAFECLHNGKHVVEVNVEMDCLVGPILSSIAQQVGLVYTLADGDQPSLIAKMVNWARNIGLTVIAAGKGTEEETHEGSLGEPDTAGMSWSTIAAVEGTKTQIEMASVANATKLVPDVVGMHRPNVRLEEAVELFSASRPGILRREGVVDALNSLTPERIGVLDDRVAHGVFIVVTAPKISMSLMRNKGAIVSNDQKRAILYQAHHLCGVETLTSIDMACRHGQATGAPQAHCADVIAVAKKDLEKGAILDGIGGETVSGIMYPANEAVGLRLLPLGLAKGVALARDVAKGTPLSYDMLSTFGTDFAWSLRGIQDRTLIPHNE